MTTTAFPDHFSAVAARYAAYRPHYPAWLAERLAAAAGGRAMAWDVGCGNGQLAVDLGRWFDRVSATDPSAQQIESAVAAAHVEYRVAAAESSGLPDACADLIVAAQAAHWFRWPEFVAEAMRVAKPGAAIALVTYADFELEGHADVMRRYVDLVGPYWPAERALVQERYASLNVPGEPEIWSDWIEQRWTRDELTGYVATWSATQRYIASHGTGPFDDLVATLAQSWPDGERRPIRWPLTVKLTRR